MLLVNGERVTVASRKSEALREYKHNVLQVSTSNLRLVLPKPQATPDRAFCSYCGGHKDLNQLVVWFKGQEALFYACKDKRRHCLSNLQKGRPPKKWTKRHA